MEELGHDLWMLSMDTFHAPWCAVHQGHSSHQKMHRRPSPTSNSICQQSWGNLGGIRGGSAVQQSWRKGRTAAAINTMANGADDGLGCADDGLAATDIDRLCPRWASGAISADREPWGMFGGGREGWILLQLPPQSRGDDGADDGLGGGDDGMPATDIGRIRPRRASGAISADGEP